MKNFNKIVGEIKKQANVDLSNGAVTRSYMGDRAYMIEILNQALATEIVCVLRYKAHFESAKGIHSAGVVEEFLEHAKQEQAHVDLISKRISQLGGTPNFDPKGLSERSHTSYSVGKTLHELLKEDLIAERIVIGVYQEMIRMIQNDDPTTRIMIEGILKDEEDHADDISTLLFKVREEVNQNIKYEQTDKPSSYLHLQ